MAIYFLEVKSNMINFGRFIVPYLTFESGGGGGGGRWYAHI